MGLRPCSPFSCTILVITQLNGQSWRDQRGSFVVSVRRDRSGEGVEGILVIAQGSSLTTTNPPKPSHSADLLVFDFVFIMLLATIHVAKTCRWAKSPIYLTPENSVYRLKLLRFEKWWNLFFYQFLDGLAIDRSQRVCRLMSVPSHTDGGVASSSLDASIPPLVKWLALFWVTWDVDPLQTSNPGWCRPLQGLGVLCTTYRGGHERLQHLPPFLLSPVPCQRVPLIPHCS